MTDSKNQRETYQVHIPGLSIVELVLCIEELFGVTISDDEAETIHTVGDIKGHVLSLIPFGPTSRCSSQESFYSLRGTLCRTLKLSRQEVRPSTTWKSLLAGKPALSWRRFVKQVATPGFGSQSRMPLHRKTVGDSAKLLAALDQPVNWSPSDPWTSDEISRVIDRLIIDRCEIFDFTDDAVLVD